MSRNELDWREAKVLMVDDTPQNLDVLRKVLTPEGYRLAFANSGERALQIALKTVPDLIMLDVMMPGIDGIETCRRLKTMEETKHIPVIFITAKTDIDDLIAGFEVGAVDYITKPFKQEEVCVRVRTHVTTQLLIKRQTQLIAEIEASEQRFRLLAAWSPIGIFQVSGADSRLTYANQQWWRIAGLDAANHIDTPWLTIIHPEDIDDVKAVWQQSLGSRTHFQAEFRLASAAATTKQSWVQARATPISEDYETEDMKLCFIGTLEDISERKRAETRMRQAKEDAELAMHEKSDFLAGMTHELRTPMNAIIGYAELLMDSTENNQDRDDLERIGGAGKYLLSLINNVLDLSKVEANKMPLDPEPFEVLPLLEQVQATIKPLLKKNNNTFVLEAASDLGTAHNDPTKLQQILINLLSNACKFTENGIITLSAKRRDEAGHARLILAVSDTGIGLSQEQMSRLFKKYAQANEKTSKKYGGTGLGLVLSREFARLMGGDISVSSEEGKGTTFSVHILASI
jgi:PAS domain S-box-containing protein